MPGESTRALGNDKKSSLSMIEDHAQACFRSRKASMSNKRPRLQVNAKSASVRYSRSTLVVVLVSIVCIILVVAGASSFQEPKAGEIGILWDKEIVINSQLWI